MKYLVQILVGYLLATPLTDKVELNIMNTQWGNILTYVWVVGAFAVWWMIAMVILFTISAISTK